MQRLDRFGKFLILEELGSDGAGHRYRAAHAAPSIESFLYLRLFSEALARNEAFRSALESAVLAGSQHNHLHLTRVDATGTVGSDLFLTREHLGGTTLQTLLARCKKEMYPLGADHVVFLAQALVSALDYLHGRKVDGERATHAGICPLTIGISYEGEVKLCDWELFQAFPPETRSEICGAFPGYVAPEVRQGEPILARSNIYSLGAMLFEILTRKAPPVDGTVDAVAAVNLKSVFSGPASEKMKEVLRKTIHPDPEKRYEDVRDVKAVLDEVVASEGIEVSAFNFAFFMHTLFREEADEETEKLDEDRALTPAQDEPEKPADADRTMHLADVAAIVETVVEEEIESDSDEVTMVAESTEAFMAAAAAAKADDIDGTVLAPPKVDDDRTVLGSIDSGKPLPLIKPIATFDADDEPLPELAPDDDEVEAAPPPPRPAAPPKAPPTPPLAKPATQPPRPAAPPPLAKPAPSPPPAKPATPPPLKPAAPPPKAEAKRGPAPKEKEKKQPGAPPKVVAKPSLDVEVERPSAIPPEPRGGKKILPLIIVGAVLFIGVAAGVIALIFRPKPPDTPVVSTGGVATTTPPPSTPPEVPSTTPPVKPPVTATTTPPVHPPTPVIPPTTTPVIAPTTTPEVPKPTEATPDAKEAQRKELQSATDQVTKLETQNRFDDAKALVAALEKKYPDLAPGLAGIKQDIEQKKDDYEKKQQAEKAKADADAKAAEEKAKAEALERDAKSIEAALAEGRFADARAALDGNAALLATPRGADLKAKIEAAAKAAAPQTKEGDLVEEGDAAAAPPRPDRIVEPKFPPIAKRQGVSGRVLLRVLVSEDGSVIDTKVVSATSTPSGNWGFQQAAQDAAKSYTFFPATKEGVKVKMWVQVPFDFKN